MSPEQSAQKRDLDGRSDLFSLGVTLFELLAGRRPFDASNDVMTMLNIAEGQVQVALPDSLPPAIRDVVLALIEKDPANRPQTGDEVVDALAPFAPPGWTSRTIGKLVREARPARPIPREGELSEAAGATEPMVTGPREALTSTNGHAAAPAQITARCQASRPRSTSARNRSASSRDSTRRRRRPK